MAEGMAQVVEYLPSKLKFKSQYYQNKKSPATSQDSKTHEHSAWNPKYQAIGILQSHQSEGKNQALERLGKTG
jgi:hypothetical protein